MRRQQLGELRSLPEWGSFCWQYRTGRSEGALRVSLANIRKRLQRSLDARGYQEAMIREILSPPRR